MTREKPEITRRNASSQPESINPEPKEVEVLAYQLWLERGCPIGDDQQDWFRAEEQLRQAESIQQAA